MVYTFTHLLLMRVPHDIDWVKERVRWYWDNRYLKQHQLPLKDTADSKPIESDKKQETKENTIPA